MASRAIAMDYQHYLGVDETLFTKLCDLKVPAISCSTHPDCTLIDKNSLEDHLKTSLTGWILDGKEFQIDESNLPVCIVGRKRTEYNARKLVDYITSLNLPHKVEIELCNGSKSSARAQNPDSVRILLFGYPKDFAGGMPKPLSAYNSQAYGGTAYSIYQTSSTYLPATGVGTSIFLDSGIVLAEIRPRLVTVLWSLHYDTQYSGIDLLISAAKDLLDMSLMTENQIKEKMAKKEEGAVVKFFNRVTKNAIKTKTSLVSNIESDIPNLEASLTQSWSKLALLRAELDGLNRTVKDDAQLCAEFQKLRKTPMVKSMTVQGDNLIVNTNMIEIRSVPIGYFAITISPTTINIVNSTPAGSYHHPHIQGSSTCFGNAKELVFRLLGNGDYFNLISLIIAYLQTFDDKNLDGNDYRYRFGLFKERYEQEKAKKEAAVAVATA